MPYSILGAIDQMEMLNGATCENPCVILTLENVLMFCDDIVMPENWNVTDYLAEIPIEFGVLGNREIPVAVETASGKDLAVLSINDNNIYISIPCSKIYTSSICVSYSGDWYTNEIGNNKSQGTSDLTEI